MVTINLHGHLGEIVGESWKLAVSSVAEAIRAININTKQKLFKFLYENDKKGVRYKVIVNEQELQFDEEVAVDDPRKLNLQKVNESELNIKRGGLKTIDIVPVLEGSGGKGGGFAAILLGIVLIAVAIFVPGIGTAFATALVIGGIGLVAAGVMVLLSKPPKFDDFRESDAYGRKKTSYLFDGPVNVTREGGPVPVGYGRLLIGSQVIQSDDKVSYVTSDYFNTTLDANVS